MAFYGFNGDSGECYSTPYTNNYDYNYDYDYDYVPSHNYNYESVPSEVDYSTYTYDYEPKYLQYEPTPYVTGYVSSEIKYTISYSTREPVIVPEFEEYDPTPYDGGYDATIVYGKPLQPSDKICYPRTEKVAEGYSLEGFSFSSIPSPYGKNNVHSVKPRDEKLSNGSTVDPEPCQVKEDHNSDNDDSSSTEDDHVSDHGSSDNGYEYSTQVSNIPYGAGLESMDICECLFGHWPCLAKMERDKKGNQEAMQRESYDERWKSAADYLFGWPLGYGDQKDGGYSYGSYPKHGY